jgi:hypothetical protein
MDAERIEYIRREAEGTPLYYLVAELLAEVEQQKAIRN